MTLRTTVLAGLAASMMATASCSKSPEAPATPSGPSTISNLLLPRIGGLWGGDLTLVEVQGGTGAARNAGAFECVGAAFDDVIGEVNYNSLEVTQTGSDVTAKLVSSRTGLACTYQGKAHSGTNIVMHATECTPKVLAILCHPHPETGIQESRVLDLTGSSLTASFDDPINPTRISGTAAHTYNILDRSQAVGSLVARHTFDSLTRR